MSNEKPEKVFFVNLTQKFYFYLTCKIQTSIRLFESKLTSQASTNKAVVTPEDSESLDPLNKTIQNLDEEENPRLKMKMSISKIARVRKNGKFK